MMKNSKFILYIVLSALSYIFLVWFLGSPFQLPYLFAALLEIGLAFLDVKYLKQHRTSHFLLDLLAFPGPMIIAALFPELRYLGSVWFIYTLAVVLFRKNEGRLAGTTQPDKNARAVSPDINRPAETDGSKYNRRYEYSFKVSASKDEIEKSAATYLKSVSFDRIENQEGLYFSGGRKKVLMHHFFQNAGNV